jgi:ribosomal-protein-serine acetyltransferase
MHLDRKEILMATQTYRTLLPLFDELRGEHVLLRPYRESDAVALREAVTESREHLRPWMPFYNAHQTIEESRDWIIHQMVHWLLREDPLALSIWDVAAPDRFLGGTGIHPHDWDIGFFEIGYWLRASAEGYGYVTEAARLVTDFCFTHLHANRVSIRCDERNLRSAAVARRLGFTQEARLRNDMRATDGSLRTTLVFSMIPSEWAR